MESLVVLGFKGQIDRPHLTEDEINDLWSVQPSGNVSGGQAEMIPINSFRNSMNLNLHQNSRNYVG